MERKGVPPAGRRLYRRTAALVLLGFLAGAGGCNSIKVWREAMGRPEPGRSSPSVVIVSVTAGEARKPAANAAEAEPEPRTLPPEPVLPPPLAEDTLDLETALGLAGVDNPTIALAQEAVEASLAEQLQAQALLLPTLDAGVSVNIHRGTLESARGVIRDLHRQSLYVGAGASAVGAGTVGFPGARVTAHLADALFEPRAARENVAGRRLDAEATRNAVLLETTDRFFALAGAEADLRAEQRTEEDLQKVVKTTADFSAKGQGREGDAQRTRAEALLEHATEERAEEAASTASADLARLLDVDPAIRLHAPDGPIPLVEFFGPGEDVERLVQTAVANRPDAGARSADVAVAQTRLRQEQIRPFVPFLSVGFSAGQFGGGSDEADTRFGHFSGRTDFDAVAFWSFDNLGLGNLAVQKQRRAVVGEAAAERARVIDQIRREVVDAYALTEARRRDVDAARRRVRKAGQAFESDYIRARNLKGLPIETLNSLRLLEAARHDLIRAVIAYDQAQFRLFVALGRPPTDAPH